MAESCKHEKQFQHVPLDPAARQIRLVRLILPYRPDEPIQLELKHNKLQQNKYTCLSYMWGSQAVEDMVTIFVDKMRFNVTSNLYTFLARARELRLKDWLWIDAICIDQSNVEERNNQVGMMGDIYRLAKRVFLYPGDHTKLPLYDTVTIPSQWSAYPFLYTCLGRSFSPKFRKMFRAWRSGELSKLMQSEYWARVWVWQEVLLAKRIYLVSSVGILEIEGTDPILQYVERLIDERRVSRFKRLLNQRNKKSSYHLMELLGGHDHWLPAKCTLRHDQIYALLGLVDVHPDFPIDYGRSVEVVALDVLQFFGNCAETFQIWLWDCGILYETLSLDERNFNIWGEPIQTMCPLCFQLVNVAKHNVYAQSMEGSCDSLVFFAETKDQLLADHPALEQRLGIYVEDWSDGAYPYSYGELECRICGDFPRAHQEAVKSFTTTRHSDHSLEIYFTYN